MTDRSLIIIDELCRSTSVEEGTAIAMAICEDLALSGAYTYVTTHYTLLTKLANLFFNIKVWQMQTISSGDPRNPKSIKLDYKFSLIPGATTFRGYGIYMVRNIWPADVMEIVDEIHAQLTQKADDPRFPALNGRARLRYNLECKMKKLKLQKKLTVANFNQCINEYNDQIQNMGENLQSPEMYLQELNSTGDNGINMDHSIFDASENSKRGYSQGEISKIYLDDLVEAEEDSLYRSNLKSEQSRSYFIQHQSNDQERVFLSPVSIQGSSQTSIISPSKAKQRMQEIFTPDTQLDMSQTSSIYHSMDAKEAYGVLVPKVNLSYSDSQCSLNLTQNALKLEEDSHANISKDQRIFNSQRDSAEELRQRCTDNEWSRIIFGGLQNNEETALPHVIGKIPSLASSRQVEKIRLQNNDFPTSDAPFQPVQNDNSEQATRITDIESPFANTFARPLQIDCTKTSTPLITKIKHNARGFGSSGTSTLIKSKGDQNKTPTSTSKISFTILNNVGEVDMQSVQEDLESFVEDIQSQDMEEFSPEENRITSNERTYKANHLLPQAKIIEEPTHPSIEKEDKVVVEGRDSSLEENSITSNIRKYRANHLFPIVKVIEGPANPSFEEEDNIPNEDTHTLVRPIVRNPIHKKSKPSLDILEEVSNRDSDRTNDIPFVNTDVSIKLTEFHETNQSSNIGIERAGQHIESSPKTSLYIQNKENGDIGNTKNLPNKSLNDQENILRIQKFNGFSSPGDINQSKAKCENLLSPDAKEIEKTADKADNDGVQILKNIIIVNANQDYQHVADSTDVYESARSSPDMSYSPLTASRADICKDFTSQENVYHATENVELCELDEHEQTENGEVVESNRIQEIIELSDELEELHLSRPHTDLALNESSVIDIGEKDSNSKVFSGQDTTHRTDEKSNNLSQFYEPVLNSYNQEINQSFITENDKTTEEFLTTRHNNLDKDNITRTKIYIQKDSTGNTNDKRKINKIRRTEPANSSKEYVEALVHENAPTKITDLKSAEVEHVSTEQRICYDSVMFAGGSPEICDKDIEIIDEELNVDVCKNTLQEETQSTKENTNPMDKDKNKIFLDSRHTIDFEKSHRENTRLLRENSHLKTKTRLFKSRTSGLARARKRSNDNTREKLRKKCTKQNIEGDNNSEIEEVFILISEDEDKSESIVEVSEKDVDSGTLKKRKLSQQTGSFSIMTHSIQTKLLDEKATTSISEASKLRNLDGDVSSSSSKATEEKSHSEVALPTRKNMSNGNAQDKSITSVSEASRKRNLDQITTSSTSSEKKSKGNTDESTVHSPDECNTTNDSQRQVKKYLEYRRNKSEKARATTEANIVTNSSTTDSASAKDSIRHKFISPSKLTQKAIREEFFEADKKFYQSSGSSTELAKLWEQRLKRPSLKQIKQSTCLATIRKTQEGVEVIPVNDKKIMISSKVKHKILRSNSSSVNMNIFSDKNADTFDEFIKSDKKDYKSFNFNFGYGEASSEINDGKMFNFKQVNAVSSEYTQNSFSLTFVRKRSEDLNLASQQSSSNLPFLTQNADFTLTPDGFYKQNRDDIHNLINKYK